MKIKEYFKDELDNPQTQYFILDTKGSSENEYGDIDFVQYQWRRSRYNLVEEGDVILCRRPSKSSETGQFYFFGAAKIGPITGKDTVISRFTKAYPFQEFIHQTDLEDFIWTWKERGKNWGHFFNQYGMNKIPKDDFVRLLYLSKTSTNIDEEYDAESATNAAQNIQKGDYSAEDNDAPGKSRSKQQVFSNKVKTNYGNKCAICSISTKEFLIGSHIIPWARRKDIRLDPSNGICLCVFHDNAFDKGFISINEDYRIMVTTHIKIDAVLSDSLNILQERKISLPSRKPPNQDFLDYHRKKVFNKFVKK